MMETTQVMLEQLGAATSPWRFATRRGSKIRPFSVGAW